MISFIVPVYNASAYLPTCIESLIRQTEKDLQILLVDDGSTDDSLAIAQRYAAQDQRIQVLTQAHEGQSVARNKGVAQAKGDYIAFVDADDWIDADWCEKHLAAIEGVDYVQSGHPRHRYQFTTVWGRLYRREIIQDLLFEKGRIYEDVLWSLDLWLRGARCRVISYSGYHYTRNPQSTTATALPKTQHSLFVALRDKAKNASIKGKAIIWFTMLRLKLHFLRP